MPTPDSLRRPSAPTLTGTGSSYWLWLIWFVFFPWLAGAAPDDFLIQTWDTASGLPHNTVRSIAQTPDGYLWIGTENGLARFDGVRFENFDRENN